MKRYLKNLIEEKGRSLDDQINIEGHIGLTYGMLVDYLHAQSKLTPKLGKMIRHKLVMIDFKNGDVFHFLDGLAGKMVEVVYGTKTA